MDATGHNKWCPSHALPPYFGVVSSNGTNKKAKLQQQQ